MRRSNDVRMGTGEARARAQAGPGSTPRRSIGALLFNRLINVAIAKERRFNREVMAEVLAEVNDDLERAVRSLTVELADLKETLAEVRLAFVTDRTQALELPKLPLRAGTLQ
jgi:hypothetical protein